MMTRITSRLYQSKEDFRIMLGLTEKFYPSVQARDRPAGVDIEENLDASEFRSNARLWFADECPIGWGEECIRKTLAEGEAAGFHGVSRSL